MPARTKKKPSGRNVAEDERHTTRLHLRVPDEVADLVRERADEEGGASAYVTRLVLEDRRSRHTA